MWASVQAVSIYLAMWARVPTIVLMNSAAITAGQDLVINNKRTYRVVKRMELGRGLAKLAKAVFVIEGKRGAAYSLTFGQNGFVWMQNSRGSATTDVHSIALAA